MLQTIRNSLIFFLILVHLNGCASYEEITFKSISSLQLVGKEKGKLLLRGNINVYNPNKKVIVVKKAQIRVLKDGNELGVVIPDAGLKLQPEQDLTIPFTAEVELTGGGIIDGILSFLTKKDVLLQFKGYIVVKVGLVPVRIPVDFTEKIRL